MNAFELSRHIAERLEENGLDYAIGGALALTAWAIPRDTKDVDISVFAQDEELGKVIDAQTPSARCRASGCSPGAVGVRSSTSS